MRGPRAPTAFFNRLLGRYRVWEAGKPPDIVWEFGPPSSIKGDAGEKKEKFRQVGVREHWLVDPLGEHHDPRLQGFELVDGKYVRMPWEKCPDGTRRHDPVRADEPSLRDKAW